MKIALRTAYRASLRDAKLARNEATQGGEKPLLNEVKEGFIYPTPQTDGNFAAISRSTIMGTARTSNKDILVAIEAMSQSIVDALTQTAAVAAPVAIATPVEATASKPEATAPKVDEAYLAHMNLKAASHATKQGAEVVLYSRRNKGGEVKLAYALRARYDDVVSKQPSCLGALGSYQP